MPRKTTGRLFAVGDIHGCAQALQSLLENLNPGPSDTVVVLGDMVDRGPDSAEVLRQLLRLGERTRLVTLLGNHEEMLLQVADGWLSLDAWTRHGGDKTLESYGVDHPSRIPAEHLEFLRAAKTSHEQGGHLFAHACYLPHWPLAYTPRDVLLWQSADPGDLKPHCSGQPVVLGHTPQPDGDILDLGYAVLIDTDCWAGGWLTALEVGGDRVVQANRKGRVRRRARYVRV